MDQPNEIYIQKIYAVNKILQKKPVTVVRKDRKLNSLVYKNSGKSVYRCGGREYVSDKNNIVLLCKNKEYVLDCIEPGLCIMIEFDSCEDIGGFFGFGVDDRSDVERLFRSIASVWSSKKEGYVTETLMLVYKLLSRLFFAERISYSTKKQRDRLYPVVEYIERNYCESDLSNEKLAAVANMSVVYFRKLFTDYYGIPPMRYVQNVKMEKAKEMLLGTDRNIGAVANAVGYANIYSFSRTFKKIIGVSPSKYVITEL